MQGSSALYFSQQTILQRLCAQAELVCGFVRFDFFKGCFHCICCNLPDQGKYENEWKIG